MRCPATYVSTKAARSEAVKDCTSTTVAGWARNAETIATTRSDLLNMFAVFGNGIPRISLTSGCAPLSGRAFSVDVSGHRAAHFVGTFQFSCIAQLERLAETGRGHFRHHSVTFYIPSDLLAAARSGVDPLFV